MGGEAGDLKTEEVQNRSLGSGKKSTRETSYDTKIFKGH